MLTIHAQKLNGELEPVVIEGSATVLQLSERLQQQLLGSRCRVSLVLHGVALGMNDIVEACLSDGAVVNLMVRPDAWRLREVDMDTELQVPLYGCARWEGETLHLSSESACAAPGWDVCPDLCCNFAAEATVKLDKWPGLDWQGRGLNCVFTTSLGGHNEHLLPLSDKVGKWHHLCMVYDAASSCITLYADGQAGEPKRITGNFRPYKDGTVEIGRNPEWKERGIVGRIRNATVWPQGLDIKDLPGYALGQIAEAEAADLRKPTDVAGGSD